jgi:hypothetical protein
VQSNIDRLYQQYNLMDIETILKYRFKDRAYLIAAVTHPSSFANRITVCYER